MIKGYQMDPNSFREMVGNMYWAATGLEPRDKRARDKRHRAKMSKYFVSSKLSHLFPGIMFGFDFLSYFSSSS